MLAIVNVLVTDKDFIKSFELHNKRLLQYSFLQIKLGI